MPIKGLTRFCALYGNFRLHKSESSLSVQTIQFLLSRTNDGIKRCPENKTLPRKEKKKKKVFRCYTKPHVPQRGSELDQ